jgi:hypothetical protein
MVNDTEKELSHSHMEEYTLENFKMIKNTDGQLTQGQVEKFGKVSGKTERLLNVMKVVNGYGTYTTNNGDKYVGEIKNAQKKYQQVKKV